MRRWSVFAASLVLIAVPSHSLRGQVPRPETTSQIRKEFVLGQHPAQDLEQKDGSIGDQAIVDYVQGLANRLARAAGGRAFEVRITRGSDRYAYLLPQDVLYISGSLFERLENEAELAGLLAHELAHMHGTAVAARSQATTALRSTPCVLASQNAPTASTEDRRELELRAAKAAAGILRAGGYDPAAMVDLLSKLAYEHPPWAKAIVPEDLMALRMALERDVPSQRGFRIDSSEFMQQHAQVVAALGHAANKRSTTRLTSLPRR